MQTKSGTREKLTKRTIVSAGIILFLVPLAIAFGMIFLDDRKHYFISLVIIVFAMVPFFMVFEKRKPQAREIVVIAVLCALGVAGRVAFYMLPQLKPVVAIVIIAGVCFGPESGFLVGAVTGFVSNFFFGQSPLTPWQMFCFGSIGFLAGVLFKKGFLPKKKIPLCIYGGLATFLIYGGIINIGGMLIWGMDVSFQALMALYLSAIPFDLIHAASTVIFLFLISQPMIEKLDRIKKKYGLLEP